METPASEADARPDLKSKLFWPLIIVLLILCIVLGKILINEEPLPGPTVVVEPQKEESFNLLITKAVQQQQKLEVCRAEFDHWQMHEVKRSIISIRKGSLTDHVTQVAPDWLKEQVLDNRYNESKARIITFNKAIVEFEVDFADPAEWTIAVDGDTATVAAPAIDVGDVNVPPESLRGWVVEEDFMISGKKERDLLLRRTRENLQKHTKAREFRDKYRAECRSGLATFFLNLFKAMKDPRLQDVRHVYVTFADDQLAD